MKLYANEPDAELVRELLNLVVSEIARVEVPAAFWRKNRMGEISGVEAKVLNDVFEDDWWSGDTDAPVFAVIEITEEILDSAARHMAIHGLRAYDAIQLATAVAARAADPDLDLFASFDHRLNSVATIEGFRLIAN